MAINIEPNVGASSPRPIGRLGQILERIIFRTRDEPLIPRLFARIALPAQTGTTLGEVFRKDGGTFPLGARILVVNVETGPVRYCDADRAALGFGELWATGSAFQRTFRGMEGASLFAESGAVVVNVTVYGIYD